MIPKVTLKDGQFREKLSQLIYNLDFCLKKSTILIPLGQWKTACETLVDLRGETWNTDPSSEQAPRPPRQAPEDQLAISAAVQGALHADPGLGPVERGEKMCNCRLNDVAPIIAIFSDWRCIWYLVFKCSSVWWQPYQVLVGFVKHSSHGWNISQVWNPMGVESWSPNSSQIWIEVVVLVTGMSHVAQGAVPIATSPGCLAQIATVAVFMFSSLSMELWKKKQFCQIHQNIISKYPWWFPQFFQPHQPDLAILEVVHAMFPKFRIGAKGGHVDAQQLQLGGQITWAKKRRHSGRVQTGGPSLGF